MTQASSSLDNDFLREGANSSDKFIVGVIGATLMIVQVVVLIAGLTSWLKVVPAAQGLGFRGSASGILISWLPRNAQEAQRFFFKQVAQLQKAGIDNA